MVIVCLGYKVRPLIGLVLKIGEDAASKKSGLAAVYVVNSKGRGYSTESFSDIIEILNISILEAQLFL